MAHAPGAGEVRAATVGGMLAGMAALVSTKLFGTLPNGTPVTLYTIQNDTLVASFVDYGARLVSLRVPDRAGTMGNILLGYATLEEYVRDTGYLGAVVGRVANRLAKGRFPLDGQMYQVPLNDGPNALHGGVEGFDKKVWSAQVEADAVRFGLVSPDGDQGFPGRLSVEARYRLTGDALEIEYVSATDAPTVVNVTNHGYYNLAGESSGTILEHVVRIPAARYTPVDATLIPTGELADVEGTPFDFRSATRIGARIDTPDEQLRRAGGYDHNWAMDEVGTLKTMVEVSDPASGRAMTVQTTQPGVQFYTGNMLDGTMPNREGGVYGRRSGFCVETQHYPDTPNQPGFPAIVLRPGEELRSRTVLRFSTLA